MIKLNVVWADCIDRAQVRGCGRDLHVMIGDQRSGIALASFKMSIKGTQAGSG